MKSAGLMTTHPDGMNSITAFNLKGSSTTLLSAWTVGFIVLVAFRK